MQTSDLLQLDYSAIDFNTPPTCGNLPQQNGYNCHSKPHLFLSLNDPKTLTSDDSGNEAADNSFLNQRISPHPDWEGLKHDTKLFLFYQFFVIGALYVMPEDLSGWSDEVKDNWEFDDYRRNIGHVVWDSDKWWINYILHPYWGGTYYVRARNRGYDQRASVWYSVLLSSLYEFGSEALFERASAQDLIITPLGGYFLGEYMLKARSKVQAKIAAKASPTLYDKTLLIATDPIGWINYKTSQFLGFASKLRFQPISGLTVPNRQQSHSFHFQTNDNDTKAEFTRLPMELGLKLTLSW